LLRLTGQGHGLAGNALEVLTQLEAELGEVGLRLRRNLGMLATSDRGAEN
jgi:hypothetical protein